jgi:hypothetical protein
MSFHPVINTFRTMFGILRPRKGTARGSHAACWAEARALWPRDTLDGLDDEDERGDMFGDYVFGAFLFCRDESSGAPGPHSLGLPAAAPRALPSPIGLGAPRGGDGPALILWSRGRSLAAYELVVQRDCRGHLVVVD